MSNSKNSLKAARLHTPAAMKKRNPVTALGGLLGALVMSVIAGILLTAAVTPVVAVTGTAAGGVASLFQNLPSHIDPGRQALPSSIYAKDADGKRSKIAQFYAQDRVEVGWDEISQFVKDAAVAVEDPNFYSHGGVNFASLARATVQNAISGDGPGASTISMQYVRNVLVQEAEAIIDEAERKEAWNDAMRRDADRKLKEMRLAISLEKQYTKNEILLGYLNIALFGRQIYGIESAASYYYNKSAKDLNLSEAASLVAIVNSPSFFQIDIEENLENNRIRRDHILERMLFHGKITEEQYEEAINTEIVPVITPKSSGCTEVSYIGLGHFCNYVKLYIENDASFGNSATERLHNLSRGGFQIDTTVNLKLQAESYEAMVSNINPQYPGLDIGSAAVTTEVGTGRVLAMVQNRQFSENPVELEKNTNLTSVNYNTDYEYGGSSGFQIASTFKPFNLANWLKQGRSLNEVVNANGRTLKENNIPARCMPDGVYGYNTFEMENANRANWGTLTVLRGMAVSSNAVFASTLEKTDLCDIIDTAEAMGLHRASDQKDSNLSTYGTRELSRVPSTAYAGIDEVAPITMSTAFAGFSGKGKVCDPIPIDDITDIDGNPIPFTKSSCRQAIDPDVAAGVAYALEYNVQNGIAPHARSWSGVPHFAKTGTSDYYWHNWTVGGSTRFVTAVWAGNVSGKISNEFTGIPQQGKNIFQTIVNAADGIFGGEAFDPPNSSALRQVLKKVPDVTGKSLEEATKMLEALGFSVKEGGDTDSSAPKGTVAKTDPAGGSDTPEGSDITIYISNGKLKAIPDGIVGVPFASAKAQLNSAGFSRVEASCDAGGSVSDTAIVLSSNPASGSEAKSDSRIVLTLDCAPPTPDPDSGP